MWRSGAAGRIIPAGGERTGLKTVIPSARRLVLLAISAAAGYAHPELTF